MREGDTLIAQDLGMLARNLLKSLILLNDLSDQGNAVQALECTTTGEHIEHNFVLDMALILAEDRRREIVSKTKNGLKAARTRWKVEGRPRVFDNDKRTVILACRENGESFGVIGEAVSASAGTVSGVLKIAALGAQGASPTSPATPVSGSLHGRRRIRGLRAASSADSSSTSTRGSSSSSSPSTRRPCSRGSAA